MNKKQLKKIRKQLNLTQEEAAEVYGCGVEAWRNWEQGRRPVPQWLSKIFEGLK